ncbi:hypothetical protein HDV05_005169 [Chytridiales sp. JEL 0842]|nr:hypothetical protein HDV05_005169 [Chytridiales sp. JEL 0842]
MMPFHHRVIAFTTTIVTFISTTLPLILATPLPKPSAHLGVAQLGDACHFSPPLLPAPIISCAKDLTYTHTANTLSPSYLGVCLHIGRLGDPCMGNDPSTAVYNVCEQGLTCFHPLPTHAANKAKGVGRCMYVGKLNDFCGGLAGYECDKGLSCYIPEKRKNEAYALGACKVVVGEGEPCGLKETDNVCDGGLECVNWVSRMFLVAFGGTCVEQGQGHAGLF